MNTTVSDSEKSHRGALEKVLIIGASGLLAKPVIRHLDKAGFQLRLFSRTIKQSMFDQEYEIVRGDVFDKKVLSDVMDGCDAVHISLSKVNEAMAAREISDLAVHKGLRLISTVSGCTVSEENRWFPMIDNKFQAEQTIIRSGIPYMIFRPTWFFETLGMMVRDGKAMMLGRQPNPSHWVAASDFARMVATAYRKPEARNKIFFIFGPELYLMKDLLEEYCKERYPEIKKVTTIPLGMVRIMAILSGNKEFKDAAAMFAYFEKVKEMGDPDETNRLLGKPETTFEQWLGTAI
jgi:uncharacterized protein YbjT (DUF2867 family)